MESFVKNNVRGNAPRYIKNQFKINRIAKKKDGLIKPGTPKKGNDGLVPKTAPKEIRKNKDDDKSIQKGK